MQQPTEFLYIDQLPSIETEAEKWDLCFREIQSINKLKLPRGLTPSEKTFLLQEEAKWLLVLHWVARKKWISNHRIPYRKRIGNFYEPEGNLWYWFLELCIQCHSSNWGKHYVDASDWYKNLILERMLPNYAYASFEGSLEEEIELFDCRGKENYLSNEKGIIGDLRRNINPWHPTINKHHYRLMQACIEQKDTSDIFRKNYWNKFKAAYSRWISALAGKEFQFVKFQHEANLDTRKIVMNNGRGKHRLKLPPAPQKYLEKQGLFYAQRKTLQQGFQPLIIC